MVAERTKCSLSFSTECFFFLSILFLNCHTSERLSTVDVTALVQIEAGLSHSGLKTKIMPDCEAIKFFFFKITLDQIKLYTLYSRGKE